MCDGRDDVLHTAPALKNIVTVVTVVTENSFLPCRFSAWWERGLQRGAAPFAPRRAPVPLIVIGACGNRCQRYYGVTFGTKVKWTKRKEMISVAKTISHCQGKGSLTHNSRKFSAKNVDCSRTKDNVVFVQQTLSDAYDEIFGAAVERYNAKQKRSDRKITEGYFKHVFKCPPAPYVIKSADKRKSFYEDVVMIGSMEDTGVGSVDAEIAKRCLAEYMNGFQERNPNFRVFNAVLHMDEATPHLHIDYIPVGHYKQGVDTQNGIAQALKEMGHGVGKDAISRWREHERAILEKICNKHGIEISAPEKSRGSLTVEQYKEYAELKEKADNQRQAVKQLDSEISSKNLILEWRQEAIERTEQDLDKLGSECMEKRGEVDQLDSAISEKQNALTKTDTALAEKQAILSESAHKVFKIDYIDNIETGKTVFGGKVTVARDDYDRLTDLAKKQIAAESKEGELTAEVTKLKKENEELTTENINLREQAQVARSLKFSFSDLQRELDVWKQKYNRVMEFIESLNLKEKLDKFLHPVTNRHLRR